MATKTATMERYELLKEQGSESLVEGRLEEALATFDRACEIAEEIEDRDLRDLAYCNWSAVAIRLRRPRGCVPRLQEMLLRTTDSRVAMYSSYNLALAYDDDRSNGKALFYARIAQRYAEELGEVELRGSALNQIGHALMAMNRFEEATEHLEQAERLLGPDHPLRRGLVLANLGYCSVVLGRVERGFRCLFESLRTLRRASSGLYEPTARMALSFAYLHADRPIRALQHAHRALEGAERSGDDHAAKYALLLLGESYKRGGDAEAAEECFTLLQETYYPDMPEVPGLLLEIDLCRIINLGA
jgi:tetratricopeptide (TPR) repeat protein